MLRIVAAALCCIVSAPMAAEAAPRMATSSQDLLSTTLRARLFPGLDRLLRDPRWREALAQDAALKRLADERRARVVAASACMPLPGCIVDAHVLHDRDIAVVADALTRLAPTRGEDGEALAASWRRDAAAINRIMAVYGKGAVPRYPRIDSMSLDATQADFPGILLTLGDVTAGDGRYTVITPPLAYALGLLDMNGRDEAVRYEPLTRENAAAMIAARRIDWRKHPYTAIIVPGGGPEDPRVALGAPGKLRLMLAVERFRAGDAPFIIVSGGNVHPDRTPYNEAVEMRRELIERFDVPADRVVLEPYARHTTTNLRNAARLLAAMRAPVDRDALIVTDRWQSDYIAAPSFVSRNATELGYQPGTLGARVSPTAQAFRPARKSLTIDPFDPLDP